MSCGKWEEGGKEEEEEEEEPRANLHAYSSIYLVDYSFDYQNVY